MMNNKLPFILLFSILGNVIAWFHMNAQFKWNWAKEWWFILLGGIPISYLFYYATRYSYEHFNEYWAIRPIGFGIGTLTFAILTSLMLGEIPSQKIIVSMILASVILYINLSA